LQWGRVATVLLCSACSAVSSRAPVPDPLAEIPIEIRHRLPTVDVTISGESFKLFLDLGGHRGLALTTTELMRAPVRFVGTSNEFRNSLGEALQSRNFVADNVTVAGFPLGTVAGGEFIFGGTAPPDRNGYIGMPILGRYLLVADYPAKRIRLYRSGDSAALESECGARTFAVAFVNGIAQSVGSTEFGERTFLWDTGATDNVIRPSALPSHKAAGRRIDDGPPVVTIGKLSLGDHDVGPLEFRLVPFGAPAVDAYLGEGFFASRKVCLDIQRGIGAVREAS
jgi:hypothetical protein